jgi:hypothetical protein
MLSATWHGVKCLRRGLRPPSAIRPKGRFLSAFRRKSSEVLFHAHHVESDVVSYLGSMIETVIQALPIRTVGQYNSLAGFRV